MLFPGEIDVGYAGIVDGVACDVAVIDDLQLTPGNAHLVDFRTVFHLLATIQHRQLLRHLSPQVASNHFANDF